MSSDVQSCFLLHVRDPPFQLANAPLVSQNNIVDDSAPIGTRLLHGDDRVNIWEFLLRPGDSCAFHRHKRVYLFLNLAASLTQALEENGRPDSSEQPRMQQKNQITFVSREELGAHGVRNVGTDLFQQFIVEFKKW